MVLVRSLLQMSASRSRAREDARVVGVAGAAGRGTATSAPRSTRRQSTTFRHVLPPWYATFPGTSVSSDPPSAKPCRGPWTYDSGMNATGVTPRSAHTSLSRARVRPRDSGRRVRQPCFAKSDAEKVHARFAPSRTTVSRGASSAFGGAAAAAAETCRDALMRFARREGPARDALGIEAGAGAGRGVAPDHARAAARVGRAAWR